MKRTLRALFYALLFLMPATLLAATGGGGGIAAANHVVIAQLYGSNGNVYSYDFIELYNPTSADVDMSGWSVQYNSATGTGAFSGNTTFPAGTIIKSHGYYLIQEQGTASTGTGTDPTADLVTSGTTNNFNMSGAAGKVALVNNSTTLAAKPTLPAANVIDLVAYGTTAAYFEGTGPAPGLTSTTTIERKSNAGSTAVTMAAGGADATAGNGYDSDDNSADFVSQSTIVWLNSSSPLQPAAATPTITPTGTLAALTTTAGTASSTTSFSVSGTNLTAGILVTPPTGFEVSTSATTGFAGTITLSQTSGSVASTTVYVRLAAADAAGTYTGNVALTSTGATTVNVATVSSTVSAASTAANHVVIAQLYGSNGNVYSYDFIELYNPTSANVDMSGWSVQYNSATGTGAFSGNTTFPAGTIIKSHGYYLIQEQGTASTGTGTDPTADLVTSGTTNNFNMSGSAGKVALVNNSTTLAAKPTLPAANVIDLVAYGTTAAYFEGTGPAPGLSATTTIERKSNASSTAVTMAAGGADATAGNGYDSDDNSADFISQTAIVWLNSSSPLQPGGGATTPTISSTGTLVALSTTAGTASSTTSFSVSGSNLTAGIVVTPPAGFEVSTSATTGFAGTITLPQTSGSVASTTVYVRLAAADAAGTYTGNVALTSTGATTVNVATVSSTVSGPASTISSTGTLTALSTTTGTASSTTSFSVSGSNLTAGIIVTAPTGFEVSTSATTGFASTITLPQTSGSVSSTTVYVRLAATDAGGTYSGNITLTSTAATTVNVATASSTVFGTAIETISMGAIVQTYGNPDFAPATSNNTAVPIVYTSDNAAVATIVNGKVHIVAAGTANITASQAGDGTYAAATNVVAPLTVTRAIATVTPDNQTKIVGAANPTLTVSYSGFVNGETSAVVTTQPTITTTATTTSVPGNYAITASGAAAANYNFIYKPGTLQVTATPTYASLASLTFNTGTLSPAFDPATLTYTNFIDNAHSTATITATAGDPAATVSINGVTGTGSVTGALTLVVGNNNLTIVVTSRDGSTKATYNVNAMRGATTVDATHSMATNVISPNGDGQNDFWIVKDIASYPNNKVTVFDGAGRTVYSKVNYTNDWAGTLNGSPLSEGTYYYTIDLGQNIPVVKGYITIVRNRK